MPASAATEALQKFVDRIRARLRDYPHLNKLIRGQESTDRQIAEAIQSVLEDINAAPPVGTTWSWDTFPNPALLIEGVVAHLQDAVSDVDLRNYMPVQIGPLVSPSRQKGQLVAQKAMSSRARFEERVKNLKMAFQLRDALGGVVVNSEEGDRALQEYVADRVNVQNEADQAY